MMARIVVGEVGEEKATMRLVRITVVGEVGEEKATMRLRI